MNEDAAMEAAREKVIKGLAGTYAEDEFWGIGEGFEKGWHARGEHDAAIIAAERAAREKAEAEIEHLRALTPENDSIQTWPDGREDVPCEKCGKLPGRKIYGPVWICHFCRWWQAGPFGGMGMYSRDKLSYALAESPS